MLPPACILYPGPGSGLPRAALGFRLKKGGHNCSGWLPSGAFGSILKKGWAQLY